MKCRLFRPFRTLLLTCIIILCLVIHAFPVVCGTAYVHLIVVLGGVYSSYSQMTHLPFNLDDFVKPN